MSNLQFISFLGVNDNEKSDVSWQKIHTDQNEHLVCRSIFSIFRIRINYTNNYTYFSVICNSACIICMHNYINIRYYYGYDINVVF